MVFRYLIETHSGEQNYVAICSKLSENKWLDFQDYMYRWASLTCAACVDA